MKGIHLNVLYMATLALCTASEPAQAQPAKERDATITVGYADLDIGSPSGQARLQTRIRSAASVLCLRDTGASPTSGYVDNACVRAALANANAQVVAATATIPRRREVALARSRDTAHPHP